MHAKRAESECNMDFDWEDTGEGIIGCVWHEGVEYRGRGNSWWSNVGMASDHLADELNKSWTKWFVAPIERNKGHAEAL